MRVSQIPPVGACRRNTTNGILATARESFREQVHINTWMSFVLTTGKHSKDLDTILSTWTIITAHNAVSLGSDGSATRKVETMRCHAQENYEKDLKAVQELEGHLGISCCWVPEDEEWQAAAQLVANRKYQRALDNLEQLVVSWIFELSKMNQSGTGKCILLELTLH